MSRTMRAALVLAAALLVLASPVLAAPSTPTPNEIDQVAKELWCPLCNGVRLDNCELQACVQMREEIAQKLTAGDSVEEIKAYFVQRYGDVVLGMPSGTGFNLLAWGLPILAAVVAIGWLVYLVRLWMKRRTLPSTGPSANASNPRPGEQGDDYLRRVDEEMRHYQ